jgi:hypothetical protein
MVKLELRKRLWKLWLSGLLGFVVWWLETNVSEAVLLPSSGLKFVIMEAYPTT